MITKSIFCVVVIEFLVVLCYTYSRLLCIEVGVILAQKRNILYMIILREEIRKKMLRFSICFV